MSRKFAFERNLVVNQLLDLSEAQEKNVSDPCETFFESSGRLSIENFGDFSVGQGPLNRAFRAVSPQSYRGEL